MKDTRPEHGIAREKGRAHEYRVLEQARGEALAEVDRAKRARQAIEKSEERLRLAQAAAQVGTWEWDPATNSSSLSPELQEIFGVEPSDARHAEKWASRVLPQDMPKVKAEMEAAARSGSMEFEYRYQHPERGLRWFYCKGRRFSRDENDTSMFGVVLDVTDRKQLEQAAQKAHEDLDVRVQQRTAELASATEELRAQAQLLHLAHDAIIVRDLSSAITFWNVGAEKTYGWTSQEALGHVTHVLFATQFPEPLEDIERKLFETGSWEGELVHRRKDGSEIIVESRHALEFDDRRRPIRILEMNRDVTRHRQAEQRVVEQAQLLDLANDAIFVRTLDSKLTYWNRGAERLYGWKKHEVLGRLVPDILHTDFPIPFPEIIERLTKHGDWEGELTHSKRDGTRIMVSSRWTMWRDKSGTPLGYLEINTDITERKLAEQSLRMLSARLLQLQDEERRRIARELHDSAGQLLVALDLNLASIQRESVNLEAGPAKSIAESKELVQELSKELRTISHLLHPPLLDEAGLPSAVRWYVDGFAQRSKIPVKLELSPDLGRLPRDLETTIFRIVQECLTNVHRHSQSPNAEIHISRTGDRVMVEIRDEGKGMPAESQKRSTKPFMPGVGIQGMRERVRQLGGQFEVQPVKPRGTLIRATLPAGEWVPDSTDQQLGAVS